MNEAAREIDKWNAEIDREIARLVREGTPPLEAAYLALHNVQAQRKADSGAILTGGWKTK